MHALMPDQNLIKLPTVHLGVASINIEKRADRLKSEGVAVENIERSDIGNINRAVRSYNHFAEQVMNKIEFLMVSAIEVKQRISMKFQDLKQRIYQNEKTQKSIIKKFHDWTAENRISGSHFLFRNGESSDWFKNGTGR